MLNFFRRASTSGKGQSGIDNHKRFHQISYGASLIISLILLETRSSFFPNFNYSFQSEVSPRKTQTVVRVSDILSFFILFSIESTSELGNKAVSSMPNSCRESSCFSFFLFSLFLEKEPEKPATLSNLSTGRTADRENAVGRIPTTEFVSSRARKLAVGHLGEALYSFEEYVS